MLHVEKMKAFNLSLGRRQGCSTLLLLFKIVMIVLTRAIMEEKERKGIHIRDEEVKFSLTADDVIWKTLKTQPKNSNN